jgi:MFS superfamily sulfate permease-like transporter
MIAITNLRKFAERLIEKAKKIRAGILPALLIIPMAVSSSSSIGSTIFSGLWSVVLGLFKSIASGFGSLFNEMMSGFGQSVVMMFQSFGFSMAGYGVWAPTMFVVGILVAIMVGYLFFTFIDAEKDVTGLENDL